MLRRNMPSAECQISGSKGRYLVFTLPFFQIPMMTTQHLSTRMIGKKPKNARNCESWVSDEAGIFRVSIHDESGDGGIFSQSAAKPNCAPVVSGLGSENLA